MSIQASTYTNTVTTAAYTQTATKLTAENVAETLSRSTDTANRDVTFSQQGRALASSDSVYSMSTAGGTKSLDLSTFFSPPELDGVISLELAAQNLLLPSAANVKALQAHISSIFPGFLSANGIAEAPAYMRFDDAGQLVLPADYAYAEELKSALKDNPAMARELQTVNALASHVAAIQESEPFREEAAGAANQTELDAIIKKYSYLFNDNRTYPEIALLFTKDGTMSITADNEPMV
ncbi:MAG: hypothetical protein COC19_05670 [SAR86 cluster bacterium]|uniref:Uncharacterized protein n=1 Tax=SAR86 cluster bacterium TaxID=2030880 RepID=A0A2A4ML47_9GAMM|nr:MAG: hypothetical protein COC19_05670 [SAR86 cluster bacterium]